MSGFSIGIGIGLRYNRPILGKFNVGEVKPTLPDPIASYRAYDKTNDDADRDVLTDLTGNGHDIQLYNFGFAENSGFGLYGENFDRFKSYHIDESNLIKTNSKLIVHNSITTSCWLAYLPNQSTTKSFKIKVSGVDGEGDIYYRYVLNEKRADLKLTNGIFDCPASEAGDEWVGIGCRRSDSGFTIEQIPDYKGALVSDGVDDYGLCKNFPIFTKEKGYTVCAIRKWLDYSNGSSTSKVFLSKRVHDQNLDNPTQFGAFTLDKVCNINNANYSVINYGTANATKDLKFITNTFTYLTSEKWNDTNISTGNYTDNYTYLNLFFGYVNATSGNPISEYSSIALYALEIYDRDLTDEEIAKVKARMIAEYEAKTGNTYEDYMKLNESKLDIAKLK